jgi:hypothetical protein
MLRKRHAAFLFRANGRIVLRIALRPATVASGISPGGTLASFDAVSAFRLASAPKQIGHRTSQPQHVSDIG